MKAIADSTTGERQDILKRLFSTMRHSQDSVLGEYTITQTGDTDVETYGVSTIRNDKLTPPTMAPRLRPE